jgi:hypothetical protein
VYFAGLARCEARTATISWHSHQPKKLAKDRGEGGVNRGLIYLINGLIETSPIQNVDSSFPLKITAALSLHFQHLNED